MRAPALFICFIIVFHVSASKPNGHVHENAGFCDGGSSKTEHEHKPLFPMNIYDIGGTVIALVAAAFANAGGAGGGGIFVPLLILCVQFSPHGAIPLSKAMIFGGALTFVSLTFRKKHPDANKPLIDYDIALMFEPMVLCGTTVGVILNRVFPSWVLLSLLEVLLVVTAYKTFKKGFHKYAAESEHLDGARPSVHTAVATDEIEFAVRQSSIDVSVGGYQNEATEGNDENKGIIHIESPLRRVAAAEQLKKILDQEARTVPLEKVALIALVFVLIVLIALMRGGHGAGSIVGIENCSLAYWLLTISVFPLCVGVSAWVGRRLREEHSAKVRLGYEFTQGMVQWNARNTVVYPLCCFLAGCAAGLLGIGGGLVLGPMLLEMEVRPEVSSATSSLMVLFTASCTTAQFAIMGQLDVSYALWFGFFTSMGAIIGVLAVQHAVQVLGRASYIILSLAVVIFASAILIPLFAIPDLVSDIGEKGSSVLRFHHFCGCMDSQ